MQNINNSSSNDEIDLLEIILTLWAFKFQIALICILGIAFGIYKSLNSEKRYTANATYEIFNQSPAGLSLGPDKGSFSLAAVTGGLKTENLAPIDQVMGRSFIENLDKSVNLRDDKFYNPTPEAEHPWRVQFKKLIGWKSSILNPNEIVWQGVIQKYRSTIDLTETLGGSINISVTHNDPDRSAEIANAIMRKIIEASKRKSESEQEKQLKYLGTTLADSLEDLEKSTENLKLFTIQNGAIPLQDFSIGAQKLNVVREDLLLTTKLHDALVELTALLETGTTSDADYISLRKKYPIIDEVTFRRVLGQNEIITIWSWPELTSAVSVLNTLSDRKARLELQTSNLQLETKKLSDAVEIYKTLEREAEIAEANYTVLIEQVKAQKTVAGFRPETSEIYEYAAPPLYPSTPKRNKMIAIGGTIGLFTGSLIMYLFAIYIGAFYSGRAIIFAANARLVINAKSLNTIKRKSISKLINKLPNRSRSALRNLAVEIHQNGSNLVALTSANSKLKSVDLAFAIASYTQSSNLKIAIINFSEDKKNSKHSNDNHTNGPFTVFEEVEQVSILQPNNNAKPVEMLAEKDFQKQIESIQSKFNYIILCADNQDGHSLAGALTGQSVVHIAVARRRKTKSQSFNQLKKMLPIQGLIYE